MSINHEAALVADISRLYENDSANDIIIHLDDDQESVKANKVVLCARSPYFSKILNNNMFNPYEKIQLNSSKKSFEKVLQYLYTGKMEFDSLELNEILKLLKLLELLEMIDIYDMIYNFVIRKLEDDKYSPAGVLQGAALSEVFGFVHITNEISIHIKRHCAKFSRLSDVRVLSDSFIEKLLINDGSTDHFMLVANWLQNNVCEEEFKIRLLSYFDLKTFTAEELLTVVRKSSLYSEGDILDIVGEKVSTLQKEFADICKEYGEVYDRCNIAEDAREQLMEELSNEKEFLQFLQEKISPTSSTSLLRREFEMRPRKDEYV